MRAFLNRTLGNEPGELRGKIVGIYALLLAVNAGAWVWAFLAFHHFPLLLGTAMLAYSFGLRHAVDADHIAAIDNVTRKLMQDGKRPVSVGFFFSLGHSTVVILASVAVAATAMAFKDKFEQYQRVGGVIGTLVSAVFLLAIAAMNVVILFHVYGTFQRVKAGETDNADDELKQVLCGRGFLARIFRPLFNAIRSSWQMYPLGFLFGLGFDTATEVGLLGISAATAARGLPIWSILVFPALFTAGMSLIDTTDGVIMLGAYEWAFVKPLRKLYYNMTITFVSVIVALLVGGIEALGLIGTQFNRTGSFWRAIGRLNDNFGTVGIAVIGIFLLSWAAAWVVYRFKRYDELEVEVS